MVGFPWTQKDGWIWTTFLKRPASLTSDGEYCSSRPNFPLEQQSRAPIRGSCQNSGCLFFELIVDESHYFVGPITGIWSSTYPCWTMSLGGCCLWATSCGPWPSMKLRYLLDGIYLYPNVSSPYAIPPFQPSWRGLDQVIRKTLDPIWGRSVHR